MGSENRRSLVYRLAALTLGLAVMAMGIVLCIRANLGITPISCPPYVLSLGLSPTVGQFTFLMHLVLVAGQWLLLRREFRPVQWMQILLAWVFGCFIDGCMRLISPFVATDYLTCIFILLAGNALLALGMYFEMRPHLILVLTDGFVQVLRHRTSLPLYGQHEYNLRDTSP